MSEEKARFRYYADFYYPGFEDSLTIWATDRDDAERQAREHANMPWKGWPHLPGIRSRIEITVTPEWDAVILPGGEAMLRREYERRQDDAR